MIGTPQGFGPNYQHGRDPYWRTVEGGASLLIDPVTDMAIATWESEYSLPYFYKWGFLKKNHYNPAEYKFTFNPFEAPFQDRISKLFVKVEEEIQIIFFPGSAPSKKNVVYYTISSMSRKSLMMDQNW